MPDCQNDSTTTRWFVRCLVVVLGLTMWSGFGRIAWAQAAAKDKQPDLSGTWERDVNRSEIPVGDGAGRLRIEQTATEITMTDENAPGRVERYRIVRRGVHQQREGQGDPEHCAVAGEQTCADNGATAASGVTNARTMTLSVSNDGKELTTETDAQGKDGKPLKFRQIWVKVPSALTKFVASATRSVSWRAVLAS